MSEPSAQQPCIRQCCLDANDVCLGCGRSLSEILAWHHDDSSGRHAILRRAADRRAERLQRIRVTDREDASPVPASPPLHSR